MTLAQIIARQTEINQRMAAIQTEATDPAASTARIEELNAEVDTLLQERAELSRKALQIRAEAGSQFDPVIKDPGAIADGGEGDNGADSERNYYASLEYRRAFRDYITRGIKSPALLKRADGTTMMDDIDSVIIPTVITEKLFVRRTNAGSLFDRVTKTNHAPGMSVKVTDYDAEIEWVGENGAATKKKGTTSEITFALYTGKIKFSISLEASTASLAEFEDAIAQRILIGARRSFDKVIAVGTGIKQPTGFITEANYTNPKKYHKMNNVTIGDYSEWLKVWSKVPLTEQPVTNLVINKTDWQARIVGMKDDNNRVIAFDTVGFGGMPQSIFMGREVVILENQGLQEFDSIIENGTASKSTAFAAFVNLSDYWFNSNLTLNVRKYIDDETDEKITKAIVLCDGKMADKSSLIPICRDVDVVATTKDEEETGNP